MKLSCLVDTFMVSGDDVWVAEKLTLEHLVR